MNISTLQSARDKARRRFLALGIPTPRNEEWKYTNVLSFIGQDLLAPSQATLGQDLSLADITSVMNGLHAVLEGGWLVTIVNGQFNRTLSTLPSEGAGIIIEQITDELFENDEDVRSAFGSQASVDDHSFVALNTALTDAYVLIRIDSGARIERPVHVAMISDARHADSFSSPRVLVMSGAHSSADVFASAHVIGDNAGLNINVVEFVMAEESSIQYHAIADASANLRVISYAGASVQRGGTFTSHSVNIGGGFVRNDLAVRLMAPSSQAYLYGISVLNGSEFVDNHTVVDHCAPHCHSQELYKGLYDGSSVGVFNGKIYVRPDAQKTTAYQSNHSILLSDKAQVNAKPQLEIWADDVKCSHGATAGQLSEEAIFYLRSRGISANKARALITYAFAADVLEHMKNEGLRHHLEQRIATKLGAEPFSL